MTEAQRRAYLEAMGIEVWINKPATPDADRCLIGPGSGSTLLLCRTARESGTRLAADIGRSLGGDPVWAWPDPDQGQGSQPLKEAIEQRLFTQVLLFGQSLAKQVFKGGVPEVLGSARIQVIANLDELAVAGEARRMLWQCLCRLMPDQN